MADREPVASSHEATRDELLATAAQTELLHRQILDAIPELVLIKGPSSKILWANKAFRDAYGMSNEELQGLIDAPFVEPDATQQYIRDDAAVFATGQPLVIADEPMTRHDGTVRRVQTVKSPVFGPDGQVVQTVAVIRDVTEQAQLEAKLRHAERMVSVGTLAAGVAHEMNNPLAYVAANLEFIGERLAAATGLASSDSAELLTLVHEAAGGAERVRRIVRGLKTFSRIEDEQRTALEVDAVIERAISMVNNEVRHRGRIVRDFNAVPRIEADETQLVQVMVNLLLNAAHALPEGAAESNLIKVTTTTDAAGRAVIEVKDTGCGIARRNLDRVFDPFFTTKAIGQGTGLGLSICHGIVTAHGGEITVDSKIGVGTTFRIALPPLVVGSPAAVAAPAPPIAPTKGGRILVLDDDPLVAGIFRRALGREHEIVMLTDCNSALDRLRAGERFDVFFCDLMMPVVTGMDVYDQVATGAPDQLDRIVFITGGAFSAQAQQFLAQVPNEVLDKPINLGEMRSLVSQMVSRTPSRPSRASVPPPMA